MRTSWEKIKDEHPDSWVLLREMEYNLGNLISAQVVYANPQFEGISQFEQENPEVTYETLAVKYTGQPIELELRYHGD